MPNPPRPDLGWSADEWAQYEGAWLYMRERHGDSSSSARPWYELLGWNAARKAWFAGLAGAVAAAVSPMIIDNAPLDQDALWRAALGAALGYVAAWSSTNKVEKS